MAEEVTVKQRPVLPANYVSIAVLRERWLQRQKLKQQEDDAVKCAENGVEGDKGDDGVLGKERDDVDDVGVGRFKVIGEVSERGCDFRRVDEDGVGGLEIGGGGRRRRRRKGGFKYGGDRRGVGKRNVVVDVREEEEEGNVGNVKGLEGSIGLGERRVNEEVEIGGKFRGLLRDGGRKGNVGDRRRFGKVWKGKNVVEKGGVVDMREESEVVEGNVVVDVREEESVEVLEGSIGLGERRVNEEVEIGDKFRGFLRNGRRKGNVGDRRRFGKVWKGKNVVEKRNVVDVREEENVKVLEGSIGLGKRQVNEEVEISEKFRGLLSNGARKGNVGGDRRKFGNVLGVRKGKNVVEKRNGVDMREESEVVKGNGVDVREEENVVDGKMLEVSKDYGGYTSNNEAVDIGRKFGDLTINGGKKKGSFRYGGDRRRFQPRKEKIYVGVTKGNEVEKPIPVFVRKQDEVEKPIPVAVRKQNEVEKPIQVAVRKQNEVEKQIPVTVRDKNEVKKQNLVDVKMSETSKGFDHRPGKEAIGGEFGALPKNGWRKGSVKYGRDHGRFGSRKYKQDESGMMWVKKCDAGADKQAQEQTADVN